MGWVDTNKERAELMAAQVQYGRDIKAWLSEYFPDLCRPNWGPHPAAIAEVIRLHYQYGKGQLTVRKHGSRIRAAVKAFDKRFPSTGEGS